jgi:peptidoglycan/LPS O-acetylase OafA/YrhL
MGFPSLCQNPRYRLLDAWRGLACLMVVVHHAGYSLHEEETLGTSTEATLRWVLVQVIRRLDQGVSLFFVISGYCIAASADATRRKGVSPRTFLKHRVRRIYPPYWFALFGFVALVAMLDMAGLARLHRGSHAVVLDSPGELVASKWVSNITLTETLRPHVWGPPRDVYTGVAWSLCYEEQFYLICFLALVFAPRRFYAALATVTAATAAVWVLAWRADQLNRLGGTFLMMWHQFAVGLAVYYRLNVATRRAACLAIDAGLAALLLCGLAMADTDTAVTSAFGLVLIAMRGWDETANRLPWLAPFRACGLRCYSIYLAHLPVVIVGNLWLYELGVTSFWARVFVMIPLVSLAGVAVGWGFFALIESRFLNTPLAARVSGPARAAEAVPIPPSPAPRSGTHRMATATGGWRERSASKRILATDEH